MDTISTKVPLSTEYIGQVRALGSAIAAQGSLTLEERTHLIILFGLIESVLQSIEMNIVKAFSKNKTLKPYLDNKLGEIANLVKRVFHIYF